MESQDINTEIDRILSSNIKDELLNHIPLQLLQSPAIQKKHMRDEMSSARSKQSFSKQNFEQDLYEKAQQIMKLKQTLQAELFNINQIVEDNQKLTKANFYLKQELKKIKAQWKIFKINVTEELNREKQNIYQVQTQINQALLFANKINSKNNPKMSIISVFTIENQNKTSLLTSRQKNQKLKINSQIFVQNVALPKSIKKSILSQTDNHQSKLYSQIQQLKNKVQVLARQNVQLKKQLQSILKNQSKAPIFDLQKFQQQKKINQTAVECYSSVFLQSVFQETENSDHIINKILFSQQKPFFEELKEAKYFGKMVLGKKNGSGMEEYKNGFHYEGNFSKDQRNGIGKLFYKDKLVYRGEWKMGKFYGKGILYYYMNMNIQKIEGNFKNGWLQGHSTISFHSGHKIRAIFKKNRILSDGMFLPNQRAYPQLFASKSYSGKIQFKKINQNEDKIIFVTFAGQVIDL